MGDGRDLEMVPSFREVHTSYETVKSVYAYSISKHDEQNVLHLKLVLFHLKCKTGTTGLSV
jgi:hypothetical protein